MQVPASDTKYSRFFLQAEDGIRDLTVTGVQTCALPILLADLRRSRVAMAGVWAASLCLAMSGVSRHDAVLSLKRGYTREGFCDLLRDADVHTVARHRPGARIVAAWSPGAGAHWSHARRR